MKILLLRPDNKRIYRLFKETPADIVIPPLGILYLDSYLASHGYDCSIWDSRTSGSVPLSTVLDTVKPDIVGIGCTTPEISLALESFKEIKKHSKDIITVAGGIHFSALPNERYDCIDYVVRGEAEQGLLSLLRDIEKSKEHAIVTESRWVEDIDSLPIPRWEKINNWGYLSFIGKTNLEKMASVATSRGCPYHCIFCYNSKNPQPVRYRSIENVEEEIKKLSLLGVKHIAFADDSFNLIHHRTLEMCEMLKPHKLKWVCLVRADRVKPDLVAAMVNSGCVSVSIGVESGNKDILKSVNKGETIEQIREAFSILSDFDIEKRASFILGHPYDTRRTVEETIALALSLPTDRAFFNIMTPYPSSEIYEWALRDEGIHITNRHWEDFRRYGNAVIATDELSSQDLVDLQKDAHRRFYTQPRILLAHLSKLIHSPSQELYFRPVVEALRWEQEIQPEV